MVSGIGAMFSCIFILCDVRIRIAITCMVLRGYLMGSPLKLSRFPGEFAKGRVKIITKRQCERGSQTTRHGTFATAAKLQSRERLVGS